jgi:hypothetical protein
MTLKLALVACLGLGAYAQTPAPAAPPAPQVPPEAMTLAVYYALLQRVDSIDKLADKEEAANKDPKHANRKWIQVHTGLTDQEYAAVHPIMRDAISAINASRAQANDAFNQARKANGGGPLTAEQKKALGALNAKREQLVLDHVQQIATALGSSRFQQFDAAVRALVGPSMKVIPLGPKK